MNGNSDDPFLARLYGLDDAVLRPPQSRAFLQQRKRFLDQLAHNWEQQRIRFEQSQGDFERGGRNLSNCAPGSCNGASSSRPTTVEKETIADLPILK